MKILNIVIMFLIAFVILAGCNQQISNYLPDYTNQAKNQTNNTSNQNLVKMGNIDQNIRGDWYGIAPNGKNCLFSFHENSTYEFVLFNDYNLQLVSENEQGTYFIMGDNNIMFVSYDQSSLPDNLFFLIDGDGRKMTFCEESKGSDSSKYEVYNTQYYAIF